MKACTTEVDVKIEREGWTGDNLEEKEKEKEKDGGGATQCD